MSEDILNSYAKALRQGSLRNLETMSDLDLLKCAHYQRYSAYLAYLHSLSSCSNQTTCLLLEQKLKNYAALVDDRKGINNFASVAKSLANNVTNVSKKWSSGLQESLCNVSIEALLNSNDPNCENVSDGGCTAATPTQNHVEHFFSTLRRLEEESRSNNQPSLIPPSFNAANITRYEPEKKRTSLFPTYEDGYQDRNKFKSKLDKPLVTEQRIVLNSHGDDPWKGRDDGRESSFKRGANTNRFHQHGDNSRRQQLDESKQCSATDRINKLSKYLREDQQDEMRQMDVFRTAAETMKIQHQTRNGGGGGRQGGFSGGVKKSLGGKGRASSNKFVPPLRSSQEEESDMLITRSVLGRQAPGRSGGVQGPGPEPEDERLAHIDPKMIEMIRSEIMDHGATISWEDIAGLEFAKHTIQEIVVWPMLRPDIFTGLRRPPKGILLFGPPGTGKTLIGKCIASQSKSTFFSISASSLTSKWIGDGEKMVRALFAVARVEQPSVVFIDEIDSLLSQRSDQEHESSRRIKTEFLVQLDGAATGEEDRLLIIGATNRPQELDEAARRRLVKRLYIPLPDFKARKQLVNNLMSREKNDLTEDQVEEIAGLSDGYSGADMKNLCQEASLGPIRSISSSLIAHIDAEQVRAVTIDDFKQALKRVRSSVSNKDLDLYIEWDRQFGMSS